MCALHRLSPAVVGESYGLAVTTSPASISAIWPMAAKPLADGLRGSARCSRPGGVLPAAGGSSRAHGSLRTQKANQ